jgi:hypothetical protein
MKKTKLDKAAEKLTALFERHLAELPASDRDARDKAFHRAVVRIGSRAKSEEPPKKAASQRVFRQRG